MRTSISTKDLVRAVLLPSALLTALMVPAAFMIWHLETEQRAAPIRREIAQNFAEKWGRCDLAARWDKGVVCASR